MTEATEHARMRGKCQGKCLGNEGLAPVLPGFADVQLRVVAVPVTHVHGKVLVIGEARDTPHLAEHGFESGACIPETKK